MTIVIASSQQRRDTAADWTSNNTVLLDGQIGYETDTELLKIGDGVTAWNSLAYWGTFDSLSAITLTQRVTNSVLSIAGGDAIGDGGEIRLYGSTEASNAGDTFFRSGGNTWSNWDESVGAYFIYTGIGGPKTQALTINSSQAATFAGAVTTAGNLTIGDDSTDVVLYLDSGVTSNSEIQWRQNEVQKAFIRYRDSDDTFLVDTDGAIQLKPANTLALTLDVGQGATFAGAATVQGAFTSLGIDDNATGERLQISNANFLVGDNTAASVFGIFRRVGSGHLEIGGSTGLDAGGNIKLWGSGHATNADDFALRTNNDDVIFYDASTGILQFSTGTGGITTEALSINSSQVATFASSLSAGGDIQATGGTFNPTGSTAAADSAAVGFSSTNGLMLTGQGSTYDVAALNDIAQVAWGINTGTVNVDFLGSITVTNDIVIGSETQLKTKTIEIGDWNMNSTTSVTVAHGLTLADIRSLSALIRNDANTEYYDFGSYDNSTGTIQLSAGATNITLSRAVSGLFDGTDFDSTTYNRGWITILHV